MAGFLAICLGVAFGFVNIEPAPFDVLIGLTLASILINCPGKFFHQSRTILVIMAVVIFFHVPSFIIFMDQPNYHYAFITIYLSIFAILAYWITRFHQLILTRFLLGYLVGAAAFSILSAIDFFTNSQILGGHFVWMGVRAVGMFKDPNVFGAYLVPALALSLSVPCKIPAARLLIRGVLFTSILLGLAAAGSRGAWLNASVTFLCVALFRQMKKPFSTVRRSTSEIFSILMTCGLGALLFFLSTRDRVPFIDYLQERGRLHGYDSDRFANQFNLMKLSDHFVFGVGAGRLEQYTGNFSSHNSYLRILVEGGVLSLCSFAVVVFLAVHYGHRSGSINDDRNSWYQDIPLVAASSIVGILANSFVVDTLHWRHFWLVLAIALASARKPITKTNCQTCN